MNGERYVLVAFVADGAHTDIEVFGPSRRADLDAVAQAASERCECAQFMVIPLRAFTSAKRMAQFVEDEWL